MTTGDAATEPLVRPKRLLIVMRLLPFIFLFLFASVAAGALEVQVVDGSKLQLTFDPAPSPGAIDITSAHTLPLLLQADGRRRYVLPLVLLRRAEAPFEVRAGAETALLDLQQAALLPIARTRFSERVYDPVLMAPTTTPRERSTILLWAVLIACGLLGCALLPRRAALLALAGVAVLSAAGAAAWDLRQPAWHEQHALVEISGQGNPSTDAWTWITARRDRDIEWLNASGQAPQLVAASRAHLEQLAPTFIVRADGAVHAIRLHLRRGVKAAIVIPDCRTPPRPDALELLPLVREFYPGRRVISREPGRWRLAATAAP